MNLYFDELHTAFHITFEILSILFSSSSAFMFSIHLANNKVSNRLDDSLNNNIIGRDMVLNQNTSIYQSTEQDGTLVPALNRLAEAIEHKHKENVDNIQKNIIEKMANIDAPITQPSEDFMFRYVDNGRTISDKDIQKVWADLYVNEAKNPSSVSFRTLDIVKNLTFSEMNLFLNTLNFCIKVGDSGYIPNEVCEDISLFDITRLGDVGLLKSETTLSWTPTFYPNENNRLLMGDTILFLNNATTKDIKCRIPVYILTDVGVQLASAINSWIKEENAVRFSKYLMKKYNGLKLSLHKIISSTSDGGVQYNTADLLKTSSGNHD